MPTGNGEGNGGGTGPPSAQQATIQCSPSEVSPGAPVKVTWMNSKAAKTDWIGLFAINSPNSNSQAHTYVNITKGSSGEAIFHAPGPGEYEFRYIKSLFPYDTLTLNYLDLARSGILTVSVPPTSRSSSLENPTASASPSHAITSSSPPPPPPTSTSASSSPSPSSPLRRFSAPERTSSGERGGGGSVSGSKGKGQEGEVESAGRTVWKWWQRQKVKPSVMEELETYSMVSDKSPPTDQREACKFFEVVVQNPSGRIDVVQHKIHLVLLQLCQSPYSDVHTMAAHLLDLLVGGANRQDTKELMQEEVNRVFSFTEHWPHAGTSLTPERMAAAGLYFSPTLDNPDRCVCFLCMGSLMEWNPTVDDPWTEHVKWYRECPLVVAHNNNSSFNSNNSSNSNVDQTRSRLDSDATDGDGANPTRAGSISSLASTEGFSTPSESSRAFQLFSVHDLKAKVQRDLFNSIHFPVLAHLATAGNPKAKRSAVSILTCIFDVLDIDVGTVTALLTSYTRVKLGQQQSAFATAVMQSLTQLAPFAPPSPAYVTALLTPLRESKNGAFDVMAWACRGLLAYAKQHEAVRKMLREGQQNALKILTDLVNSRVTGEIAADVGRLLSLLPLENEDQFFFELASIGTVSCVVNLCRFTTHRDLEVQRFVARMLAVLCGNYFQCIVCSKQPILCQPGPPVIKRYYCQMCLECNVCDVCMAQHDGPMNNAQHLHEGRSYMMASTTMEWQHQVLHNDGLDILATLLQHGDRVVQEYALKAIYDVGQNTRHARSLLECGVIPHIGNMLLKEDSAECQRLAAQTLASLCADEVVKVAIREQYVVPALCTLCAPNHTESTRFAAVTALCKLAEPSTSADVSLQAQIRAREWASGDLLRGGGLDVLLVEAASKEPETQRAAALALRHLCFLEMPQLVVDLVQKQRLQPILSITYSDRMATARLGLEILAHMSEQPVNHRRLFLSGVMFPILRLGAKSDMKLQELACRVLLNLAKDEDNCRDIGADNAVALSMLLNLARDAADGSVQHLAITALRQFCTCESNHERIFATQETMEFLRKLAMGEDSRNKKLAVDMICMLSSNPTIKKDQAMNEVLVNLSRDSDAEIAQMAAGVITQRLAAAQQHHQQNHAQLNSSQNPPQSFHSHSRLNPPSPSTSLSSESESVFSPSELPLPRKVTFKCFFYIASDDVQIKKLSLAMDSLSFDKLNARIIKDFGRECIIKYEDDEGDMVCVSNDDDLREAVDGLSGPNPQLKLILAPDASKLRPIPSSSSSTSLYNMDIISNSNLNINDDPNFIHSNQHTMSSTASSYPRIGSGILGGHGFVFPPQQAQQQPGGFPFIPRFPRGGGGESAGSSSMWESVSTNASIGKSKYNFASPSSRARGGGAAAAAAAPAAPSISGANNNRARAPIVHSMLSDAPRRGTLRWQKGQLLGRGAFGEVYEALSVDTGELIAVKQIPIPAEEAGGSDEAVMSALKAVKNFEREVAFMRDLEHRHIVKYLGTDKSGGKLNIFLEYVSGGSIEALLRRYGAFDEATVRTFTRQTLLGLVYLHSRGIVHCDIKGGNLLVTDGIVKLADFNACQRLWDIANKKAGDSSQSSLRQLVGTPYFMAPEVVRQSGHGKKADIWSLGCTVIQMLTASLPWGEHSAELPLLFKIGTTKTPPPYPPNISEDCRTFLDACFALSPAERPSAEELLKHPFVASVKLVFEEEDESASSRNPSLSKSQISEEEPTVADRAASDEQQQQEEEQQQQQQQQEEQQPQSQPEQ